MQQVQKCIFCFHNKQKLQLKYMCLYSFPKEEEKTTKYWTRTMDTNDDNI